MAELRKRKSKFSIYLHFMNSSELNNEFQKWNNTTASKIIERSCQFLSLKQFCIGRLCARHGDATDEDELLALKLFAVRRWIEMDRRKKAACATEPVDQWWAVCMNSCNGLYYATIARLCNNAHTHAFKSWQNYRAAFALVHYNYSITQSNFWSFSLSPFSRCVMKFTVFNLFLY